MVEKSIGFLITFLYDGNCFVLTGSRNGQQFSFLIICVSSFLQDIISSTLFWLLSVDSFFVLSSFFALSSFFDFRSFLLSFSGFSFEFPLDIFLLFSFKFDPDEESPFFSSKFCDFLDDLELELRLFFFKHKWQINFPLDCLLEIKCYLLAIEKNYWQILTLSLKSRYNWHDTL